MGFLITPLMRGRVPHMSRESFQRILWVATGVLLGVLLIGDVTLYSHHKELEARVENQERKIAQLDKMVEELLKGRDQAARVEEIMAELDALEQTLDAMETPTGKGSL